MQIGFTERGDASLDTSWLSWVYSGKPTILITKNPKLLYQILENRDLLSKPNILVHCTITGFGGTVLEPGVPAAKESLLTYSKWLNTVLRVDPIIPTQKGIAAAKEVIQQAHGRVRISFLDMYPHVIERFNKVGLRLPYPTFHAPLNERQEALEYLQQFCTSKIEVCGEPDIQCTGCLSKQDMDYFGVKEELTQIGKQRKACMCLAAKKELLSIRGQCAHKCLYYYWK